MEPQKLKSAGQTVLDCLYIFIVQSTSFLIAAFGNKSVIFIRNLRSLSFGKVRAPVPVRRRHREILGQSRSSLQMNDTILLFVNIAKWRTLHTEYIFALFRVCKAGWKVINCWRLIYEDPQIIIMADKGVLKLRFNQDNSKNFGSLHIEPRPRSYSALSPNIVITPRPRAYSVILLIL